MNRQTRMILFVTAAVEANISLTVARVSSNSTVTTVVLMMSLMAHGVLNIYSRPIACQDRLILLPMQL